MSYEIECPVCDRKASASAAICPNCGADLKMASFDDLEEVATVIAAGSIAQTRIEPIVVPAKPESRPEQKVEPTIFKAKEGSEAKASAPKPHEKAPEPKAEAERPPEKAKEEAKDEGKHGLGRLFGKKKK